MFQPHNATLVLRESLHARDDLTNIVSPMATLPSDTDSQQSQDLVMSLNFHWPYVLPMVRVVTWFYQPDKTLDSVYTAVDTMSLTFFQKNYSSFTKHTHHQTELLELSLALATYAFCHKNRWSIWTSSQAHTEGNVTVSTKLNNLVRSDLCPRVGECSNTSPSFYFLPSLHHLEVPT